MTAPDVDGAGRKIEAERLPRTHHGRGGGGGSGEGGRAERGSDVVRARVERQDPDDQAPRWNRGPSLAASVEKANDDTAATPGVVVQERVNGTRTEVRREFHDGRQ